MRFTVWGREMDEFLTIQVHEEFAKRIEAEEQRQNHRLNNLEDTMRQLTDLTVAVREMATNMAAMKDTLEAQGKRLEEIEKEPGQNWKKAVWLVVAAVVGFGIHALLGI